MDLAKLFGLPAHPLLVHVPIVLLPVVALATLGVAVVPAWRARVGWIVVALAGVSVLGVQLAIGSGEVLENHVPRSKVLERHTELAGSLRPLAIVLFLLVLALVLLDGHRPPALPSWVVPVVAVLAAVSGLATTYRLAEVGHNGARASWGDTDMSSDHGRPSGG